MSFENDMVAHGQKFAPRLSQVIGEQQLRAAVRRAIGRAGSHGFTNRGAIRLFVELIFLYGSDFDSDPQYPWIADTLGTPLPQMERAERLYRKVLEYQEKVSGPAGVNTRTALQNLRVLAQQRLDFTHAGYVPGMCRELAWVYPRKAAYVGNSALEALVRRGSAAAKEARFPEFRGDALISVLMFAFGHSCSDDLLYPWIGHTMRNVKRSDPTDRAATLEKKALLWLDHVLADEARGV